MPARRTGGDLMEFTPEHAAMLPEIMRHRGDVRHFRSEAIPEVVVVPLIDAVDLAPSVGNSRPWRIVRVPRRGNARRGP